MGLNRIYSQEKREQLKGILRNKNPSHNQRLWLVGFLKYANFTAEEVSELIRKENQWKDYQINKTEQQIRSVFTAKKNLDNNSEDSSEESEDFFCRKGEVRVNRIEIVNDKPVAVWKKAKPMNECSVKELEDSNIRSLGKKEIVLDCDGDSCSVEVLEEIKRLGLFYSAYSTGSRFVHVHLYFDRAVTGAFEDNFFDYFRRKCLSVDGEKIEKKRFVQIEGKPHFRTGKKKKLIAENKGINNLIKVRRMLK